MMDILCFHNYKVRFWALRPTTHCMIQNGSGLNNFLVVEQTFVFPTGKFRILYLIWVSFNLLLKPDSWKSVLYRINRIKMYWRQKRVSFNFCQRRAKQVPSRTCPHWITNILLSIFFTKAIFTEAKIYIIQVHLWRSERTKCYLLVVF